ncbi:feruloyl esterase-like protein [Heliocybe sulcata]|uniref:Carboxylic ester hydrolase n=1 Tax=Heliocybe sulcata TaxID=5364 RepID=A0A5C3N8K7_9AGAM|nr:feruloyl esterase-like protein [Heliocybe sulcata]
MLLLTTLLALGAALGVPAATPGETACSSFTLQDVSNVTVALIGTEYYPAGATVNISNPYSQINTNSLPAFCRIELSITTNATANKTAGTDVWLPDSWNGRLLGFGSGGLGGGIVVSDMGHVAVQQGFAGVSTDTGHLSNAGDGIWGGPHNDNAIIDFAYRALHLSVIAGKQVTEQYYGNAANKSYYLGCSTGTLKEVQQFPEDFDGVVVGSPANWMTHLPVWSIYVNLAVLPVGSPQWITQDMWSGLIHDEVMKQCDALDGVTDGIINNPLICHFQPETLACESGQNASTCLNPEQINAIHTAFSPYYQNGTYVFEGLYPGGEGGYANTLLGPVIGSISVDYYRYFILNDTTWDPATLNLSDIQLADRLNAANMNAIATDITPFVGPEHNGKVIHYVGMADNVISAGNSLHYYGTVRDQMAQTSMPNMDDYYRLFTVPGMAHCSGGYGANAFGGGGQAASGMPPTTNDPTHNVLSAMVQWVEEGVAPDHLVAAYYNNNNATQGVAFTRPLCKYPQQITYLGGDSNNATSFACT